MKKFILFYEKERCMDPTPFNTALKILYTIAKVCEHKSAQPWRLISPEEKLYTKIALCSLNGVRVESLIDWQVHLVSLCRKAAEKTVAEGIFPAAKACYRTLQEPLISKEFDPEGMTRIFDLLVPVVIAARKTEPLQVAMA